MNGKRKNRRLAKKRVRAQEKRSNVFYDITLGRAAHRRYGCGLAKVDKTREVE